MWLLWCPGVCLHPFKFQRFLTYIEVKTSAMPRNIKFRFHIFERKLFVFPMYVCSLNTNATWPPTCMMDHGQKQRFSSFFASTWLKRQIFHSSLSRKCKEALEARPAAWELVWLVPVQPTWDLHVDQDWIDMCSNIAVVSSNYTFIFRSSFSHWLVLQSKIDSLIKCGKK